MTINGNGVAASTGKQLLQIIPVNIITMLTTIICAVGLYYKFEARIASLEKSNASTALLERVTQLDRKVEDNNNRSIRVDANVLWLMGEKNARQQNEKQR